VKGKPKKGKAMDEEEIHEGASDEEFEEEKARKVKSNTGKAVKVAAKPLIYKKGKWNPNVDLVDSCQQLESQAMMPNFECSTRNSNREVIRAAMIGSKKLFEKIIKSDKKISRLTERWGVDNDTTAMKILIENGNTDLLTSFLELLTDTKKTVAYGADNVVYLKSVDTGYNDKYAYGVRTRKVALSRGGRQGNNAFVEDSKYANAFDDDHMEFLLSCKNSTPDLVKTIISYMPQIENQLINKVGVAMRAGNIKVAAYLMERSVKNGGYGLSEHFLPCLTGKNVNAVSEVKKANCTKKAFGMGNFTPLHCACLNPNPDILKHILTLQPEYLNMDDQMRKLVHYAACCPSAEPIKYLASQNVDTRDHDNMRTTPLMYAARAGNVETVKFLLQDNRSMISAKDRHGYAAIHYAAENGHSAVIKLLVEAGVKIALGGPDRKTALHIAAARGDFETVQFLVEHGAKVPVKDKFKRSPLLLACKNGNLKVAAYLLQQGSPFDEGDSSGNSPLHYACAYGYPEVIEVLMKAGANPNAVNSWNLSPTAVALLKSYFSCLRKMLDYPQTDVNCVDDEGRTLVSNAIKTINAQNFNHVAFLLRDKKADPNIADAKGLTAFDYLCAHNVDSLAQAEITADMNLDEVNTLKSEKRNLYKKYFKLFLESGADINHKDAQFCTPIFRAIQNKNVDAIRSLLENPTLELNLVTKDGKTILHFVDSMLFCEDFFVLCDILMKKCGTNAEAFFNKYSNHGTTAIHDIFDRFSKAIDTLQTQYMVELQNECRLAKKPRSDAPKETDEEQGGLSVLGAPKPAFMGLKGGARTKQTARKSFGFAPRKAFGVPAMASADGIVITAEEQAGIEAEAEGKYTDKLNEFLEFMKKAILKGADVNAKVKKPITEKPQLQEGEEESPDTDFSYDLFDYFELYTKRLQEAVEKKIDIPAKEQVPENVGYTLLHIATNCGKLPVYEFLIEEARININEHSVHGESELLKFVKSTASNLENAKILDYLISKRLSTELRSLKLVCPLLLSVESNKEEFVKTLLRHKAQVNSQDIIGRYPLLQAVQNKNLTMVELLLANNADPNLKDTQSRNSIHWAINLSNADADASNEIENCLLSSGGDLNAVDDRGRTPLHYAFVKIGDPFNASAIDPIETVSNIIARPGVNVDVRDAWGNTPLSYAAQRGSVISTLYLLKNGANIDNVNDDGNTPLNICLINGHQNESIFLIQKNCSLKIDIKVKTMEEKKEELRKKVEEEKKKKTGEAMDIEFVQEKIEFSSSESEDEESSSEEEKDEDESDDDNNANNFGFGGGFPRRGKAPRKAIAFRGGYNNSFAFGSQPETSAAPDNLKFGKKEKVCSTFSVAIRRNWQSVAFLMLEFGFDLSLAILDCFNHKKYNYVYTLLLKKADAGVYQTTNADGQNLTHLFAQNSSRISDDLFSKILSKLEAKHLDFGSADKAGRTSLHYAAEAGSVKLAAWLLERGLDVNKSDSAGVTPLGHVLKCAFGRAEEFARASLESGLDLNKRFTIGTKEHTALTYIIAEDKDFNKFVKLHELGADINKGDSDGWTPLIHYVRQNKFVQIQSLMNTFKVDTRVVDNNGKTIIHHAVQQREFASYENAELLEFLMKHADFNKADNQGHTPLYYAKRQLSGRLAAVLTKHRAKESEMVETVRRVQTSILNEIEFPVHKYNFEEDFEKFVEQCKREADSKRMRIDERVKVDPQATGNYEVCYDGADAYDCYMIKVDIAHGYYSGNTFYKMQILREKVRDVYVLFTRWGRVGTPGQFQQTPFSTIDDARKEYCSVFKSKSGNLWEDHHNFVKVEKKYRLLPVIAKAKFEDYIKAFNHNDPRLPRTELAKEIYSLMRRLCNYKIIVNALKNNYRFNSSEVPIHSLTKERISDAQAVLDGISKTLKAYEEARSKRQLDQIHDYAEELTKLTSEFYELIPTTQYKTESIPPITNQWSLQNLQRMMADLFYFEVAIKLIGAATYNLPKVNPIDYCFDGLGMKVMTLDKTSDEFKLLK
jgi:ankyrin repeat protein/predicted DNA-binding WGR domain protein